MHRGPATREELDRALLALEDQPGYGISGGDEVLELERAAVALQDRELVWRARLLSAELAGRRGELAEAMRGMQEVNELAAANGHTRLLARSHLHLAWAFLDVGDLASALANLVSNAVKYSDPGGTVSVSVERAGDEVVFCCADEGLGISESDQERLFTEFFRSTNNAALDRPGTGLGLGLGLAIVQHVAVRHGGRVEVSSELGVGSTFRVHLPAATD